MFHRGCEQEGVLLDKTHRFPQGIELIIPEVLSIETDFP